ncbi:MAG: hypothetical protein IPM29_08265 [Planctomycetes bacterium]|nr:hypothetical protein [Planctomycetota bacterium]
MKERWGFVMASVVFTGLGLAAGFQAASTSDVGADHAGEPSAPTTDAAHDHAIEFSPESLRNMGVAIDELRTEPWQRTLRVAAAIEELPLSRVPLTVPIGGRLLELRTAPGARVRSGELIATIAREPIPFAALNLALDALHPAHDELHGALRNLLEAQADAAIAREELQRIEEFTTGDQPLVPKQRVIELQYQLRRAEVSFGQAHHELELHGFTEEQIAALAAGEHLMAFDADHARRSLGHRGLWDGRTEALDACLPDAVRTLPLSVATIGELSVHGLLTAELTAWLRSDDDAAASFLPIASLLLAGRSLPDVRALHDAGALAGRFELRAPQALSADGFDLLEVHHQPGATLSTGATLGVLRDLSAVRLVAQPVGTELDAVLRSIASGAPCRATPLLPGTGPDVDAVRIEQATDSGDGRGTRAWATLPNRVLAEVPAGPAADGAAEPRVARTWALRPGTRYELRVPVATFDAAFVLPRGAVAEDGPDRIVLLPDAHGDVFEEVRVVVAAEDDEVVVLRPADQDPRLAPGTRIVTAGAFELSLAMHAGDHEAAHDHDH